MKKFILFVVASTLLALTLDYFAKPLTFSYMPPLVKKVAKLKRLEFSSNPIQQLQAQNEIKKIVSQDKFKKQQNQWKEIKKRENPRLIFVEIIMAMVISSIFFFALKLYKE